jgi:hypothetical protein
MTRHPLLLYGAVAFEACRYSQSSLAFLYYACVRSVVPYGGRFVCSSVRNCTQISYKDEGEWEVEC